MTKKKFTPPDVSDPPFAIPNWPDMNADRSLFIDRPFGMPLDDLPPDDPKLKDDVGQN